MGFYTSDLLRSVRPVGWLSDLDKTNSLRSQLQFKMTVETRELEVLDLTGNL